MVGLAVARELALRRPRAGVCVFEREPELALHQSGHNSGVVHAGIYYTPGSLKAKLCVEGARDMYAFCERHEVPHERTGKVIVALDPAELPRLDELERRGRANGVPGLRRIDGEQLRELEPHARGLAALHSPDSGIVDFRAVTAALANEVLEGGGSVITGCEVLDAQPEDRGVRLAHAQGRTLARHAVFCMGTWADQLLPHEAVEELRILPFRGSYLRLVPDRAPLVRALIYPVPDPTLPFLGVHFTRTIAGEVLVGPTAIPALAREQDAPLATRAVGAAGAAGVAGEPPDDGPLVAGRRLRADARPAPLHPRPRRPPATSPSCEPATSSLRSRGSAPRPYAATGRWWTTSCSPTPTTRSTSAALPLPEPRRRWRSPATSPTRQRRASGCEGEKVRWS